MAAALLGVSPETVVAWEQRYGFPTSGSSVPRYSQSEVLALRDSLEDGLSIASAVAHARQRNRRRRAVRSISGRRRAISALPQRWITAPASAG